MNERQHQLDLFTTAKEQRRAERLRRVAELAASTHTTTAQHLFDDDGEREARARAGEVVVVSRGYAVADIHSTFDRLAPEVLAEAGEGPGRPATAEHWFTEQAFQEATQRAQEAKP